MKSRLVIAIAGFAIGATLVGGVAVATSASGRSVKACVGSKGALQLLGKNGKCAAHTKKVTINERGPKGSRGKAGPSAQASIVNSPEFAGATGHKVSIPGTDLGLTMICDATALTGMLTISGTDDYAVSGNLQFTNIDAEAVVSYQPTTGSTLHEYPTTGAVFSYENHDSKATDTSSIGMEFFADPSAGTDLMNGTALITDGSSAVTVQLFVEGSSVSGEDFCQGTAEVTPASS